jgi:phosphonate metabolism transcriptional regulator PhnF
MPNDSSACGYRKLSPPYQPSFVFEICIHRNFDPVYTDFRGVLGEIDGMRKGPADNAQTPRDWLGRANHASPPDLKALETLAHGPYSDRTGQAIWLQIYDRLLNACETGILPPGTRLPGENQLADIFDVSRVTMRRALAKLQQEGHLHARKGSGIYVRQRSTRWRVESNSREAALRIADEHQLETRTLALEIERADRDVAQGLGLSLGSEVIRLTRLRLIQGAPIYLTTKFFPAERFPNFSASYAQRQSVRDVYSAHDVREWRRVEMRISGAFAEPPEAEALELTLRTPLLVMSSVNCDENGLRIELNHGSWSLSSVELIFF